MFLLEYRLQLLALLDSQVHSYITNMFYNCSVEILPHITCWFVHVILMNKIKPLCFGQQMGHKWDPMPCVKYSGSCCQTIPRCINFNTLHNRSVICLYKLPATLLYCACHCYKHTDKNCLVWTRNYNLILSVPWLPCHVYDALYKAA